MKLTDNKVEEFKTLFEKEFSEKISGKEAYEKAVSFLNLVKSIHKPFKNIEEYNAFLKWKKMQSVDDNLKIGND